MDKLCFYKEARIWSGTMVVSIPASSRRLMNIEEGDTLRLQVEKKEGDAPSNE